MFTEKEIDNKNPNNLDVFFGYAAFTPLLIYMAFMKILLWVVLKI